MMKFSFESASRENRKPEEAGFSRHVYNKIMETYSDMATWHSPKNDTSTDAFSLITIKPEVALFQITIVKNVESGSDYEVSLDSLQEVRPGVQNPSPENPMKNFSEGEEQQVIDHVARLMSQLRDLSQENE